jgi:serine/threonine protein kinase
MHRNLFVERGVHYSLRAYLTPFAAVCQSFPALFWHYFLAIVCGRVDDKFKSFAMSELSKPLKMVTCPGCDAKTFIPGDLPPLATEPCKKCGHSIMMPMQLRQFELRSKVGSGGMATVYRAWDTTLERFVAVKLTKKEILSEPNAMQNFLREARAVARLNHTNIIHIYTFDEWEGQTYLVMELADQGSLDTRIDKLRQVDELKVLDVGIQIASALDMALKADLLHCDIKPGNILFNADQVPKLVDFGLARKADAEEETADFTRGTPYYVAPEKIKRERETYLSDMYSLGATLYHAVTGHVPFEAPTPEEVVQAHVYTPLTPPNQVEGAQHISQPTSDALCRAMAKEPRDRFLSYDEFIMTLEAARSLFLRQQNQVPDAEREPKRLTSWWKRR